MCTPVFTKAWWRTLTGRKHRRSIYFSTPGAKANYVTSMVFYVLSAFGLSYWVLSSSLQWNPLQKSLMVVLLLAFNAGPILWWWMAAQSFQTWLAHANLSEDQCRFERERFQTNGDHGKAFFAVLTTLVGGLILKIVIERGLPG